MQAHTVEMNHPQGDKPFLLLNGQQRLALTTVSYYDNETGHYRRAVLAGKSAREVIMRRQQAGRISLYAIHCRL